MSYLFYLIEIRPLVIGRKGPAGNWICPGRCMCDMAIPSQTFSSNCWIPNFVYRVSMGTSSCGLTLQIQRIMALSFLQSLFKSGAVGAQVSLPCNRDKGMQALNTFSRVKGDTCFEFSFILHIYYYVSPPLPPPPPPPPPPPLGRHIVFLCPQLWKSWRGILLWARPSVRPCFRPSVTTLRYGFEISLMDSA